MAQRIDDAFKSQYNLEYDGPETTKLAKDINRASRSLSTNVTQMTYDLNSFVCALDDIQVAMKTNGCSISPLLPSAEPKKQQCAFLIFALREAVAKFCATDLGMFLEHIILLLQGQNDRLYSLSLMQNSRRGKSLRAPTPQLYSQGDRSQ